MHVHVIDHPCAIELRIMLPERRNALGLALGQDYLQALDAIKIRMEHLKPFEAVARPERCLLLTATPSHHVWLSGGDLKELFHFGDSESVRPYIEMYQKIVLTLESLPVPVIALVDGDVLGGGIELILGASWRMATEASRFFFKQGAVGLLPGYGGLTRLRETIGVSQSQLLLANASVIQAKEAQRIGLVQSIAKNADSLLEQALEQAEAMAKLPHEIVALQKLMLRRAHDPARSQALEQEKELFLSLWRNPFHEQFLNSFRGAKAARE